MCGRMSGCTAGCAVDHFWLWRNKLGPQAVSYMIIDIMNSHAAQLALAFTAVVLGCFCVVWDTSHAVQLTLMLAVGLSCGILIGARIWERSALARSKKSPYPAAPREICLAHAVLGQDGKEVFVGGFEADAVYHYSLEDNTWSTRLLGPCSVEHFDIAYFEGKLISIGGVITVDECENVVGTVYEYNREVEQWETNESRFPSMPTARSTPTVVTRHGDTSTAIAACGGLHQVDEDSQRKACNIVEVYSSKNHAWHTSTSLPHHLYWTSMVTIDDQCYLLGGRSSDPRGNEYCFSISLDSLMDTVVARGAEPNTPRKWKRIKAPLRWATAAKLRTKFGERLVAIGGQDDNKHTSNAVHILSSDGTHMWKRVRSLDLPEPRERTAAIAIDSPVGKMMIIGGSILDEQSIPHKKNSVFFISNGTVGGY